MKYELKVPTSLSDITLGQYQEYLKLPEDLTDNQLALKMISIFCNVSDKVARYIKASDVSRIVEKISLMFKESPTLIQRFKLGKKEYGFIPNLDEMTFGEYIDIDTFLGDWDNIEKAMAVLYRPIQSRYSDKYNIVPYEPRNALKYKEMPLSVVMSSILFFYNLGKELCQVMIHSTHRQEMTFQELQPLDKNGVGINQYLDSLTEILHDLKISLN
jgi:hypothetical protein